MLHAVPITFGVLLAIVMFPLLLWCGVWLLGVALRAVGVVARFAVSFLGKLAESGLRC